MRVSERKWFLRCFEEKERKCLKKKKKKKKKKERRKKKREAENYQKEGTRIHRLRGKVQ